MINSRLLFSIASILIQPVVNGQYISWNSKPQQGFVYQINNNQAQALLSNKLNDSSIYNLLYKPIDTFSVDKGWLNKPEQGHFIELTISENKIACKYTAVVPYQVILFNEYGTFSLQVIDKLGNIRDDALVKIKFQRVRYNQNSKTYRLENEWFRGTEKIATVELEGFRSMFRVYKNTVAMINANYNYNQAPSFFSYLLCDKNKYRPGDEVRFKSYAVSAGNWAIRKKLEVWLYTPGKSLKIKDISPYRPGAFTDSFVLHDSLSLILDTHHTLQLKDRQGKVIANTNYLYEDYELKNNKLHASLATNKHYFGTSNALTIVATDFNGLFLKGAKAKVLVKPIAIEKTFEQYTVLPDTLLFKDVTLNPTKPTQVTIPSDLFGKTNTQYSIELVLIDQENHTLHRRFCATHYYSDYNITCRFIKDSICFELMHNGKSLTGINSTIKSNQQQFAKTVNFPYKEKIIPSVLSYQINNKYTSKHIQLKHLLPHINVQGSIKEDSLNLKLINPQNIDLSWFVYQGGNLIASGADTSFGFKHRIVNRQMHYYLEIFYIFGGVQRSYKRVYNFKDGMLNIKLDLPGRVYPGQEVEAKIEVKDAFGKPVRGVDLTALAINSKLNYNIANLPNYGKQSKPRLKEDYYDINQKNSFSRSFNLDYPRWRKLAKLDTMMYYTFCYPDSLFRYSFAIKDSTQFAPFVMNKGKAQRVHVIEIDKVPVYYSWTDMPSEYSFYVTPDRVHEISLRLSDRVIVFDSVKFERNTKTILSFQLDSLPKGVYEHKLNTYLSGVESERHKRYIAGFDSRNHDYTFLEKGNQKIPIYGKPKKTGGQKWVGPIPEGYLRFRSNNGLNVTYKHENGFNYSFDYNVAYKTNSHNILPHNLQGAIENPLDRINDMALTWDQFLQNQEKPVSKPYIWSPASFVAKAKNACLKIILPVDNENKGIATMLIRHLKTGQVFYPYHLNYFSNNSEYIGVLQGLSNVAIIYNDGSYVKADSLLIRYNSQMILDLQEYKKRSPNAYTERHLQDYYRYLDSHRHKAYHQRDNYRVVPMTRAKNPNRPLIGNVKGKVFDNHGIAIPGVSIIIKGSTQGAVSDINGEYSLDVYTTPCNLVFSFIGYKQQELLAEIGTDAIVALEEELMEISEVVVVAYGSHRKSSVTAAMGSVSGVIKLPPPEDLLAENKEISDKGAQISENALYQTLLTINTLRSNFSDVGFWKPMLYTDKQGKSRFTVKFPDNITQWEAVVYAMNTRLQTGTVRKKIKSYKPIMAHLDVPRFVIEGDSAICKGKVINFSKDSIVEGEISWKIHTNTDSMNTDIVRSQLYHKAVKPSNTDSLRLEFSFSRNDGYFDGEARKIPVFNQGIWRTKGTIGILSRGDSIFFCAGANENLSIKLFESQLSVYTGEVNQLLHYKYACNEQLASKLIGLVSHKLYQHYLGKSFNYNKDVKKIIARLLKNQNEEFLWSWWNCSENTSHWMSAHILRALKFAQDNGFEVPLEIENLQHKARYKNTMLGQFQERDIDLLHALSTWGVELDYKTITLQLDSLILLKERTPHKRKIDYTDHNRSFLLQKLKLIEIKQMQGLSYSIDLLLKHKKTSIMGEVYFSDDKKINKWYYDELAVNLSAYRILSGDTTLHQFKQAVQMYLVGTQQKGRWNTYRSASALRTILPDLLRDSISGKQANSIQFFGVQNREIKTFPFEITLKDGDSLQLIKKTGLPMFYMQHKEEKVTQAKTGVEGLKIKTYFYNNVQELRASKKVQLFIEIENCKQKPLHNIMIEVPIPGGCSYANKKRAYNYGESHREYYKERAVIFCDRLEKGRSTYSIDLLPRFSGRYAINPAQVSLMYLPVVNANTKLKQINISESEQVP